MGKFLDSPTRLVQALLELMRTPTRAKRARFHTLIVLGSALLLPAVLDGEARADETFSGVRTLAMGGALRAAAVSTPALYVNPAGLAVGRLYHIEAAYQYDGDARGHLANATAVDSTTSRVSGGVGATYGVADPDHADRTYYDLRLGLAFGAGQSFSLGATLKYLHLVQEGTPRTGGAIAADPSEPLLNDLTFDAGAMLRIADFLSIGLTGSNLTHLDTVEAPMEVGGGAAVYLASVLTLGADLAVDLTTYDRAVLRYAFGAEYFAANRYPLRLGYSIDPEPRQQWVSAGIGYVDQRFAADVALRQGVVGGDGTTVTAGLRFFVH